jgi:hypothetical protein
MLRRGRCCALYVWALGRASETKQQQLSHADFFFTITSTGRRVENQKFHIMKKLNLTLVLTIFCIVFSLAKVQPTFDYVKIYGDKVNDENIFFGDYSTIDRAIGLHLIKTEPDPKGEINHNISKTSNELFVRHDFNARTNRNYIPIHKDSLFFNKTADTEKFTHYIGEQFGGGVIFLLWNDTEGIEHGLIVDLVDLSTNQIWSNIKVSIKPSAKTRTDGLGNSNAIVGQEGHISSAALLCLNSTNGGQSDWYLPSIDELLYLWDSRYYVNKTLSTISGATILPNSGFYWSSTETDNPANAWSINFKFGTAYANYGKNLTNYVRAVRKF